MSDDRGIGSRVGQFVNNFDSGEPLDRSKKKRKYIDDSAGLKKSNKVTIFTLPEQTLINIACNLSQEDAVSLLYSNKHFERACKVRLYKTIVICEKYQDRYFYDLCKAKKITILSGWENILKFFSMFYMENQNNLGVDPAKCVENISGYGFLDRGRLDSYKYLSNSDLTNILQLREFWSTAVNSFINLKSFVFPKFPLEKIFSINQDLRNNLIKLSIGIENDNNLPLEKYNLGLPNLKSLRINLPEKTIDVDTRMIKLLLKLISRNDKGENDKLEEIEFNGCFGKVDRNVEHQLRHMKLTRDINLTTSFLIGYELGLKKQVKLMNDESNDFATNNIDGIDSDSDDEIEGERDEENENDDILKSLVLQVEEERSIPFLQREKFNMDDMTTLPALKQAYITLPSVEFDEECCSELYGLFEKLKKENVKFTNIKNLKFSNVRFDTIDTSLEVKNMLQNCFLYMFPNYQNIQILELRNVYSVKDQDNSFISTLTGKIGSSTRMKKLIFSLSYSDEDQDQNQESSDILSTFLNKSWFMEELVVFGSLKTRLKHLYRVIFKSKFGKEKIKKLSFTNPYNIIEVCRKILNARIFRKFNKFENLKILDDYYFGCSKKLIEHFIKMTRINDYDSDDYLLYNSDTEFFKEDFYYVYGREVKKFFKICPNLEQFTYYGYTFLRKRIMVDEE